MEQITNKNTTWIVTGTSSGLGLELVKKLLILGYKVSALTRKPEELFESVKELNIKNLLIVKTDITNDENVKESISKAVDHFGRIDVVVVNHGYGLIGAVEEISDTEYRDLFNVNFFGLLNVIRHTTPLLRKQKSGLVFNVSSIVGTVDLANYSAYDASKHAINAVTFSLAKELKPFGVDVVLLSPGGFKTPFVGGGNLKAPLNQISEYKTDQVIDLLTKFNLVAKGDPQQFANIVIEISQLEKKPENLFIGTDAVTSAKPFFEKNIKDIEKWYDLSISTDFPSNDDDEQRLKVGYWEKLH